MVTPCVTRYRQKCQAGVRPGTWVVPRSIDAFVPMGMKAFFIWEITMKFDAKNAKQQRNAKISRIFSLSLCLCAFASNFWLT